MSNLGALGALRAQREQLEEEQRLRDRPKAAWFTPPKDGTPVKVQFLNELDTEAERYNPAFGTHFTAIEHQAPGPKGFMARALDTEERDGRDWAQEQHLKNPRAGWKRRHNFYINVAVQEPDGSIVPKIMSRNLSNQFVADLIEEYDDSDGVGITGRTYAIKRTGTGPQTQWRLKELKEDMDVTGIEPWNLEEYAVRYIPYEKQEEFYMRYADLSEVEGSTQGGFTQNQQAAPASNASEPSWDW